MTDVLALFGAERYSPWLLCLTNDRLMIFLYTFCGLVTFAGLSALGVTILSRVVTPSMVRPSMRILIGVVLVLCGVSYLTSVLSLYWGIYRLIILLTTATAAVAAVTAVVAIKDALADRA